MIKTLSAFLLMTVAATAQPPANDLEVRNTIANLMYARTFCRIELSQEKYKWMAEEGKRLNGGTENIIQIHNWFYAQLGAVSQSYDALPGREETCRQIQSQL